MFIYTELTPNPSSLKFVLDEIILEEGVADFPDAESAKGNSQLAERLYRYPFTQGVFIGRNFITLTKDDNAQWNDVIPVIKAEIQKFFEAGLPVLENVQVTPKFLGTSDIEQKIIQVIEEQVRPAVAMDGGDIIYEGFDDGIVKLKLRGSCSGCPSSSMTLKHGIQSLLIRLFPEHVKAVEAI
ncbi:MAG: NifU family protein [Bacteroidia bacterium]|nr:NifU family protein [Bacteroidia bacterium]MDW8158495.1 NifU family protein [Bacteroidia bacterium]